MSHKIRIMFNCYLRTSNSLSLGVWWVSNILTHISHFPYWIVVISSSFMCFNKFLECIDDLLRSTEIEAKKHENKAFLKEGETPQQNKRRSFAKSGRSTAQNNKNWSSAERSPVVRQNPAERSPGLKITKKRLGANVRQIGAIDRQAGRSFSWSGRTLARQIFSIDFSWAERSPNSAERPPNLADTKTMTF